MKAAESEGMARAVKAASGELSKRIIQIHEAVGEQFAQLPSHAGGP